MKVIVAGGRNFKKYQVVEDAIKDAISKGLQITQVVSGGARGVDTMGETWAVKNGVDIKRFPAEWDKYGVSAGPIRNAKMAEYGEALILIWDGVSSGSKNMLLQAKNRNLKIFLFCLGWIPNESDYEYATILHSGNN